MVKLVFCLTRKPELSREEFQAYWRTTHAPLVARHAAVLGIRRYVQAHTLADDVNDPLRRTRGGPAGYDGVAELWYDDLDSVREAFRSPEGRAAAAELLEDEKRFIDLVRSPLFYVDERQVVG